MEIDKPDAKKVIIDNLLITKNSNIDLGMGISVADNLLKGTIRKTLFISDNQEYLGKIAIEERMTMVYTHRT